jgi:carboxyl-terminal processing protease
MGDDNSFIDALALECAIPVKLIYDSLPLFVYSQNCKYFDILNKRPVFNLFNLIGINYKYTSYGFYVMRNINPYKALRSKVKIISINSQLPEIGLANFEEIYTVVYQTSSGVQLSLEIKYPQLLSGDTNIEDNRIYYNTDSVLLKLINFQNLSLIDFYQFHQKHLWIDLRNNMGGEVKQFLTFLSFFYPSDGFNLYLKKQNQLFQIHKNNDGGSYINPKQITLLVNSNTASAAEMLALKLKTDFASKIIGNKTEGKWIINSTKDYNGYFIKFPEYLFIPCENTDLIISEGIAPDVYVSDPNIDKFLKQKFAI